MSPAPVVKGNLQLGAIQQIKDGLPIDLLETIGKFTASVMSKRVREGYTVNGGAIDLNSEGWLATKQRLALAMVPLQMTGDMTRPTAWSATISRGRITLELAPQHHDKWDNIMKIAKDTGRNWREAWGIGPRERKVVMTQIKRWIKYQIGAEDKG